MAKRRSRLDIICDMLGSIQDKGGKIKPTHLMYKANLAHRQLKLYLAELLEKNLVERTHTKDADYIAINDNGRRFLQKIREMKEFEQTFGIE